MLASIECIVEIRYKKYLYHYSSKARKNKKDVRVQNKK